MTVLAELKMVNEMNKTVLRAGQKALDPPLLVQEDGALSGFDLRPGALNFGGVNDQGNAVVLPLDVNSRVDVEYTSPRNRAQRAEEGLAILRTIESVTPLAQVDPSVMLLFNAESLARELCKINGTPAKLLRTSEEVAALKKQGLVQTADGLVSAGSVGAQAVTNLTEMQTIAEGLPAASGVKISAGGQP